MFAHYLDYGSQDDPRRGSARRVDLAPTMQIDDLSSDALMRLSNGAALALRFPGFVHSDFAPRMGQALLASPHISNYMNLRDDLTKIGMTYFEAARSGNSSDTIKNYLQASRDHEEYIRNACSQFFESPMERISELLSDKLKASRLSLDGQPMFAGLVRIVTQGKQIMVHQDDIGEDSPDNEFAKNIVRQWAFNIYLLVPERGGELDVWNRTLSQSEASALQVLGSDYGLDRATLGERSLRIVPRAGELVIIDSRKLHAVNTVDSGARVSISFFLGQDSNGNFRFWS